MKIWLTVFCCLVLSGCVQQPKTPEQMAAQVHIQQSASLELKNVPSAEKKVTLMALHEGQKYAPLQQALSHAAATASLEVIQNPSLAGYVVLSSLVQTGVFSQTELSGIAKKPYGSDAPKVTVLTEDADMPDAMHFAMVVDVHVAVRTLAKRVRNNTPVVSTASLNTIEDEKKSRVVVSMPLEDMSKPEDMPKTEEKAAMEKVLMQRVANTIMQAL